MPERATASAPMTPPPNCLGRIVRITLGQQGYQACGSVPQVRVAVVAGPDPGHVFPAIALCLRLAAAGDVPYLFTDGQWSEAAAAEGIEVPRLDWLTLRHETDVGRWLYERAAV